MVPAELVDERATAAEELQDDGDHEVDNRNEQENEVEELPEDDGELPLLVDPDMIYANLEQEESRRSTFLRIVCFLNHLRRLTECLPTDVRI